MTLFLKKMRFDPYIFYIIPLTINLTFSKNVMYPLNQIINQLSYSCILFSFYWSYKILCYSNAILRPFMNSFTKMEKHESVIPPNFDFTLSPLPKTGQNIVHTIAWHGLVDDFQHLCKKWKETNKDVVFLVCTNFVTR